MSKLYMRKKYFIFAAFILLASGYALWALRKPLPDLTSVRDIGHRSEAVVDTTPDLNWPDYGQQAIGVAGYGVLATHGEQKPVPMASVAKVLLAISILQKKPLKAGEFGPAVPITGADEAIYGAKTTVGESTVRVQAGEQLNEYQALQALLIASANNIADTLSNWAFGSVTAYTIYANDYATKLGLTDTHVVDASGISPSTVSTAQDLVLLGQAAMQEPVLAQIVAQPSAVIPVEGTIKNYNIVLGQGGISGIKTGNTDQAGGCFLFAAKYNSSVVIGAIMKAQDLGTSLHDAVPLLGNAEAHLQEDSIVTAGETVAHYQVPWAGSVNAIADKELKVVDWEKTEVQLKLSMDNLKGKNNLSGKVGTASLTYKNQTKSTDVLLEHAISPPSIWWRLTHP